MSKLDTGVARVRSQWKEASEAEREKILSDLRRDGFSIIDSIRTLREAGIFSLGEAKAYVSASQTWREVARRSEFLHEQAWKVLDEYSRQADGP
jgi:hypothetical protein